MVSRVSLIFVIFQVAHLVTATSFHGLPQQLRDKDPAWATEQTWFAYVGPGLSSIARTDTVAQEPAFETLAQVCAL